jgi:hypothetical protein
VNSEFWRVEWKLFGFPLHSWRTTYALDEGATEKEIKRDLKLSFLGEILLLFGVLSRKIYKVESLSQLIG